MLLDKYLPRIEFDSYEDFKENYRVNIPDDFNFGFDIVDEWAKQEPEKKALVWCNDHGEEKTFTFTDISRLSNQTANYFQSLGIRKGTVVMLILRRRWEYWVCAVALHKIGAILIPGSLQLAKKDLIYRGNSAQIHTMVCLDDKYVLEQVDEAQPSVPSIQHKIVVGGSHEGWRNFHEEVEKFSTEFARPTGDAGTKAHDLMLVYFTSGTTGDPKMVEHDYTHPLGHIVTAKYWQQVQENKLHMSVSDSGWAKFGWGKIYGQWICGAVIFAYDMDKFVPTHLLQKMQDYKLTTFCAPPTMYRFMLQEDVASYDLSSIQNFSTAGEPLNRIFLSGVLCKQPALRRTPLGREICDMILAVNRRYGRADYLPCIAWGGLARRCGALEVGDGVRIEGRLQSRAYTKVDHGVSEVRTAYEVSVMKLEPVET